MRRVMIVTGASSGIGRALALAAARDTYDLVISARRADRLQEVAEQIQNAGAQCAVIVGEITAPQMPQRLIDTAIETFGRIDVIVNNAGAGQPGSLLTRTDEAIERQWHLHVLAPLRTSRAALPHLQKTHGQLMFVGSGLARVPLPNGGAYSLVKAAVRAAAIQLRRELRSDNIAVTYIDPGLVKTGFSEVTGMHGESQRFAANPEVVARRILCATYTRPARINAIPLHTFAAMLGEWFPKTGDWVTQNMLAEKEDTKKPTPQEHVLQEGIIAEKKSEALLQHEEAAGVPALQKTPPIEVTATAGIVPQTDDETENASASILDGKEAFDKALEPLANRMERVKMPRNFVLNLLQPNAEIKLQDAAMQWAGMPNKNERAAMQEVLQALTAAGFLKSTTEGTWTVIHIP